MVAQDKQTTHYLTTDALVQVCSQVVIRLSDGNSVQEREIKQRVASAVAKQLSRYEKVE